MNARIAVGRTGMNKPRDFRRLARAALERQSQEVLHWAEASTGGAVSGRRCKEAAKTARARVRRRRFSGEPDDSLKNRPVLQRISACDESIHPCFSQSTSVFIKHTVFGGGLNRSRRHHRAPGSVAGRFGAMPTMLSVTQSGEHGVMAASTAGVTVTVESVGWRSDTRQRHLHGRHCRPWRSGRRQGEPHLCPRH